MKYAYYCFVAIVILFSACTNDGNEAADTVADTAAADMSEPQSSSAEEGNVFSANNIAVLNQTGFSKFAKAHSSGFDWSLFQLTRFYKEDTMFSVPFEPDRQYYDAYGKFLIYSPDSSMFIDLDSYNIEIRKDGQGRLVGTEQGPDTEVSLVDLKKKRRTRLVFIGPGNSIEDAAWIDRENLALMGFQENDSATGTNPVVWKFNLPTRSFYLYELKNAEDAKGLKGYSQKERLRGVIIR